jgi:hypothetical protein
MLWGDLFINFNIINALAAVRQFDELSDRQQTGLAWAPCSVGRLWRGRTLLAQPLWKWKRLWTGYKPLRPCSIRFLFAYAYHRPVRRGQTGDARIGLILLNDAPLLDNRKLHSFSCCAPHTSPGQPVLRCTMNRAMRHRHQLSRTADEIESVLAFGKRLAFQVCDAFIYFVGLWTLVKWLLR